MKRLLWLVLLFAIYSIPVKAQTTYYVCDQTSSPYNASDANAGTSKTATWFHAPGMSTFTGTYTHHAGDQIIFCGGGVWHFGDQTLNPHSGFQSASWTWSNSGTAGSCNLNGNAGAIVTTTCDYIGVDQTFFKSSCAGGVYCRPILNLDNAVTTASPAGCSFDYSTVANTVSITGNFVIVDGFEVFGACYNSVVGGAVPTFSVTGSMFEMKNIYFHGFMLGTGCTGSPASDCDEYDVVAGVNNVSIYQRYDHNVFDNSDGTLGNSTTNATLLVFNQSLPEADHNVFNHVANGLKFRNALSVHDNLQENFFESPVTGTHGNIFEWAGTGVSYTSSTYYYNNLTICPFANSTIGESLDMYPGGVTSGKHGYIFNNISNCNYSGGIGTNAYLLEGDGGNGGPGSTFFFNNTTFYPALMRNLRGNLTANFQNNHFINIPSCPTSGIACAMSNFSTVSTTTDNGSEVWQTVSGANTQGYTSGGNWAPTVGTGATVGQGTNLTSAICAGMDNATALAACSKGYGGVTYNTSTHTAVDNTPTARGTTWDIGAYQFGGTPTAGTPTASPVAGSYSGTQNVTFSVTGGAPVICVAVSPTVPATNGTSGCTSGTLYTSPVPVSTSQTLKAIAGGTGFLDGSVGTFAYTITVPAGGVQAPANLQATANVQIQ